jgi:hypothetical protein
MRRTFFSYAGSAASAASEIILSDAVWTRCLTSKMIVLRGGVERDRGPWGWRSLVFESYEVALRDNEIDDGVLPSLTTEALWDVACCPR